MSFAQGIAALEAGDYVAAERLFRAIVERDPSAHQAWLALAVTAIHAGTPDIAVEHAKRAVALDRKNADYLNKLGVAYAELGELASAEQAFRRALKIKPAYAAAHHNLAKTLQKRGRLDESLREFERAYALEPRSTPIQSSLCGMYRLRGDPARALAVLRAATGQSPPQPALIAHFADCIADVEGAPAAVAWLRELLARQPDSQPAHYALAVLLLSLGQWREGWQHFRWRPHAPPQRNLRLRAGPAVLRGEYGLGDVLFFLRFLPLLRARGVAPALHLPGPLAKLAPLLSGQIELADASDSAIWLGDLPSLLGADEAPPALPLCACADARERLARLGAPPYLGLTWRAGTDLMRGPELGVDQRVLLKEVRPTLLGQAIRGWPGSLVCVQRSPAAGELDAIRAAAAAPVHDLSAANDDLAQMLALLDALDDYVAVSNTNIHLRAALPRTARVLVPHPPEWRWMREGDSAWFPGFGVYRQPASRDWTQALKRLRQDLLARAGSAPPARA